MTFPAHFLVYPNETFPIKRSNQIGSLDEEIANTVGWMGVCLVDFKVKYGSIGPEINESWQLPLVEISNKPMNLRSLIAKLMW